MKKDRIRVLLSLGCTPKTIAEEVPCSISHVYSLRARQEIPFLKHEISQIRLRLSEIENRICALEGKPIDTFERLLAQQRER